MSFLVGAKNFLKKIGNVIAVTSEWNPFVDNGNCRMDFVKTNPPFPQEHKLKGRVSPGLFFAKTLNFDACPKTGCRGKIITTAAEFEYDRHRFEAYREMSEVLFGH